MSTLLVAQQVAHVEQLLTPKQIQERAQVSRWTIHRWLTSGELKAVRVGGVLRIRPADWEKFLTKHSEGDGNHEAQT